MFVDTCLTNISADSIFSWMKWCLVSMCLVLIIDCWLPLIANKSIASLLSHKSLIAPSSGIGFTSCVNLCNYNISWQADVEAIYLASVVESATISYFLFLRNGNSVRFEQVTRSGFLIFKVAQSLYPMIPLLFSLKTQSFQSLTSLR